MNYSVSLTAFLTTLTAVSLSFPAWSDNPYKLGYFDRDWITLTGDVTATRAEAFTLDFGEGMITVEMDDWDWYDEANRIRAGEKVTVYGRIDDGWYEARTVEADMVYAHERDTFFHASDADEEGDYRHYAYTPYPLAAPEGTWLSLAGTVTKIDGRELMLDTGLREVQIDTDPMEYNPLDDVGYQQVDVGDRIFVSGRVDLGYFERDELQAHSITSLTRDTTKTLGGSAS